MSLGVSKIKEEKINNPVLILIKSGEQLPNALCQTQVLERGVCVCVSGLRLLLSAGQAVGGEQRGEEGVLAAPGGMWWKLQAPGGQI